MKSLTICILSTIANALNPTIIADVHVPFRFASEDEILVTHWFQMEVGLVNSDRVISTEGGLIDSPLVQIADSRLRDYRTRGDRLIFGTGDNKLVIPVNLDTSSIHQIILMSLKPESLFLQAVGSMMIVPRFSDRGNIVLNPSDPSSHVYGGDMHYMRILGNRGSWSVEGRFNVNGITTETVSVRIDPFWKTSTIPIDAYNVLYSEIQARTTIGPNGEIILNDESDISLLPIVYMSAQSTNGETIGIAIYPRDYLVPLTRPRNHYRLAIQSDQINNTRPMFVLGRHFLNKLALHFDPINRLIGFGEPRAAL